MMFFPWGYRKTWEKLATSFSNQEISSMVPLGFMVSRKKRKKEKDKTHLFPCFADPLIYIHLYGIPIRPISDHA